MYVFFLLFFFFSPKFCHKNASIKFFLYLFFTSIFSTAQYSAFTVYVTTNKICICIYVYVFFISCFLILLLYRYYITSGPIVSVFTVKQICHITLNSNSFIFFQFLLRYLKKKKKTFMRCSTKCFY